MKNSEKIFVFFVFLGLLFKYLHYPGGNLFSILSIGILLLFYFPFGFYFLRDKSKDKNSALFIISGFWLAFGIIGILFRTMYWPFGQFYLHLAIFVLPILLVLTFLLKSKAEYEQKRFYNYLLYRNGIILIFVSTLFFTPQSSFINHRYYNDPEFARLKNQYYSDESNMEFKKQLDEYQYKRDSVNSNK